MIIRLVRNLHTTLITRAKESSLLAQLRKKTGYTIANCKKALEMHNNDSEKAEMWLNEQAQAMGWEKATKVASRPASQGLVSVKCDSAHGALVEMNCETDFVAKNDKFQKMLEDVTIACFKFAHTNMQAKGPITKMELGSEQLGNLCYDGKKLSELVALFIGSVGENAVLRRAECWKSNSKDVKIAGYTHPAPTTDNQLSCGKYGALLAYTQKEGFDDIGKKICQHIVGCAPAKIGNKDVDKPAEDSDDETCLIYQEYLLDPTYTVEDILRDNQVEILDYVRFSCGEAAESMPGLEKQPLDTVQTLQ